MAERLHILLVEDTPSDVRLAQEALKDTKLEYELSIVNDGVQAMTFLHSTVGTEREPDLILLDLNMPNKSGHDVLEEMVLIEGLRDTPVILLTVSQDDRDISKALNLKMNYYLCKPIDSDKLLAVLLTMTQRADHPDRETAGEDFHVRCVIAGNPHSSAAILTKLAADQNDSVRMRTAENPNTPIEVLELLMLDPSAEVRSALVENPKVPQTFLERLAKDEHLDVRLAVASNSNVPAEIIKKLLVDGNGYVMSAAQKTLDTRGAHPKWS